MSIAQTDSKSSPAKFTPFTLQHLALSVCVKKAMKSAGSELTLSLPLFEDLKLIHPRGFRFLDYTLAIQVFNDFWMKIPMHKLVCNYDKRYNGSKEELYHCGAYTGIITLNIGTLTPYCDCLTGDNGIKPAIDRKTRGYLQIQRVNHPFHELRADILDLPRGGVTKIQGHSSSCLCKTVWV